MYRTSAEQVFAQVERISRRALQLLQGDGGLPGGPAGLPGEAEGETEGETLAMTAQVELRLPALLSIFGLSPLSRDLLICLIAAEYEPCVRTLLRAVQRELGRPWLELGTVAELLCLPAARLPELQKLLDPGGPLCRYALLHCDGDARSVLHEVPAVSLRVKIATRVARYLIGDDTLPDGMALIDPAGSSGPAGPTGPRPAARLAESLVPRMVAQAAVARARLALKSGTGLVLEITGTPGAGRRFFTEGLSRELGVPLLLCDLSLVPALGPAERALLSFKLAEVRREARLLSALPCLCQLDAHLPGAAPVSGGTGAEEGGPPAATPRRLPPELARFLAEESGVLALTLEEREPFIEMLAPACLHVDVPFPSPLQRATLLQRALLPATLEEGIDFAGIARRFALDPGRIERAARAASEAPVGRGDPARLVTQDDVVAACRHLLRHDLKSLAVRVTSNHRWEDLVISEDVYHALLEMIAYVRHAGQVYEEWGFGSRHSLSQGVSALFAGPPGTGKTMCASVMARELDMELFRVDLSRVVSKWIGETEKNLAKVFDEAQRSNAIILFDEADALFAKRTDVKSSVDRYANLEVNFLLQRMEAFSGVTILTTNFEDTLDSAFKRRLTFRLRFEKPDAHARAALWGKVFPRSAQVAEDIDPEQLGRMFEMSGGNIRNSAIRAAFLAADASQAIDMATCVLAAEREAREMGLLTFVQPEGAAEEAGAAAETAEETGPSPYHPPRLLPIRPPKQRG